MWSKTFPFFIRLVLIALLVYRVGSAEVNPPLHKDSSDGKQFRYTEPTASASSKCDKLRDEYNSHSTIEQALAPDNSTQGGFRTALLDCYRVNWRHLLDRLSSPDLDTVRFRSEDDFNTHFIKTPAWHFFSDEYVAEVSRFHSTFSDLLPLQTRENLILWNEKRPPSADVISQYRGRDLYNIFQYNFELPSEVLRLRAFFEESYIRFPSAGLTSKEAHNRVPDFSKLIRSFVAVGRFSPKAYREFRYVLRQWRLRPLLRHIC